MADNRLTQAINIVLDAATAQGAQADVIASKGSALSLKADQGELAEYKVTSSQVIGVRVIKDNRSATCYSESLAPESLAQMVKQALGNAKFSKEDEHQSIGCANSKITTDYAELYQQDDTSIDDKIALTLALEQGILDKGLVKSAPYNGFSDGEGEQIIANTKGTFCWHKERSVSCYTSALIDHNGKQSMEYEASTARRFAELNPDYCIDQAYQVALDLLEGTPVATNKYAVIFRVDCLNALFGAFGMSLSGEAAMKGINPWRDKLGEQVASPLLSLTDTPYVKGGNAITGFDSEGFAVKETPLIQQGKLMNLLHNSVTASFFNTANTHHGSRGAKGGLSVGGRHSVFAVGRNSDAEVMAGEYLELVSLQGVHSGADAVSGEFSFGASGFLCRDGKRVQAVRGITVAGNFYQMLKEIDAVGDALQHDSSRDFYAPQIRFSRLNIAG